MSLTRIGSIGINTGIQFAGVTTIATLNSSSNVLSVGGTVNFNSDVSIGGSVSIGGTLTYEDVTNIDSVGLITARNGIVVGSGITLSKDGDVFFTGIATGNGSGLTALNASNISSGTVPTARLGSGTASSSTFLRGDSTFAAVTLTTINSNTNNYLITGTGTADTLQGEADLQFDGAHLTQAIAADAEGFNQVASGNHYIDNIWNSNRSIAGSAIGRLTGQWNGTEVASIKFVAGDDTTNKDDAHITFWTATSGSSNSERLRIDSVGDIFIGTTSDIAPANGTNLCVSDSTVARLILEKQSTIKFGLNVGDQFSIYDETNDGERFRITSSGYVGINETAPDHHLHVNSGTTNGVATFESTDAFAHIYIKDNSTHATGTYYGVQGNDFRFITHNGSASQLRIRIKANGDLVSSSGATSRIAFGSGDGTLYSGMGYYAGGGQDVGLSLYATTNAGVNFVEHFRMEHNGTLKATDTSIGSLSDSRLKKNIADYSYDISKFKQFKPKSFDWINPEVHGDKSNVKGFIAQDIETVDGDWVEDSWVSKDDPDFSLISDTTTTNGEGETVGVSKMSKFGYKDAMYISVVQQLISKIETLEAKVAALEE